jgi:uncharacterized protein YjbI with pentapeptide repeats
MSMLGKLAQAVTTRMPRAVGNEAIEGVSNRVSRQAGALAQDALVLGQRRGPKVTRAGFLGPNITRGDLVREAATRDRWAQFTPYTPDLKAAKLKPGAPMQQLDLAGFDMTNTRLGQANLTGSNLEGARLAGADLRGATLDQARLGGADLTNAKLTGVRMDKVDMLDQGSIPPTLAGIEAPGIDLSERYLEGVNLSGANMPGAKLVGTKFSMDVRQTGGGMGSIGEWFGANRRTSWTRSTLAGANLDGADLRKASMSQVDARNANLRNTNLSGAKLHDTDLRGADFRGATLNEAFITSSVDLRGALFDNGRGIDYVLK